MTGSETWWLARTCLDRDWWYPVGTMEVGKSALATIKVPFLFMCYNTLYL
jgi:hypothetical protein